MAFYQCGSSSEKHFYQEGIAVSSDSSKKITIGFKPKYLAFEGQYNSTTVSGIYDGKNSETTYTRHYGSNRGVMNLPADALGLKSIDDDGATIRNTGTVNITNLTIMAIG